eukprot:1131467-Prymnesium_polylepis.1
MARGRRARAQRAGLPRAEWAAPPCVWMPARLLLAIMRPQSEARVTAMVVGVRGCMPVFRGVEPLTIAGNYFCEAAVPTILTRAAASQPTTPRTMVPHPPSIARSHVLLIAAAARRTRRRLDVPSGVLLGRRPQLLAGRVPHSSGHQAKAGGAHSALAGLPREPYDRAGGGDAPFCRIELGEGADIYPFPGQQAGAPLHGGVP